METRNRFFVFMSTRKLQTGLTLSAKSVGKSIVGNGTRRTPIFRSGEFVLAIRRGLRKKTLHIRLTSARLRKTEPEVGFYKRKVGNKYYKRHACTDCIREYSKLYPRNVSGEAKTETP